MNKNQCCKRKRRAYQDFHKQCAKAYKLMTANRDEYQLMLNDDESSKHRKAHYRKLVRRVNALYRKTKQFYEISQRSFDEFDDYTAEA